MRILLALALFAAACGGGKKSAKSPNPPAEEAKDSDMRDANKPDDAEDETKKSADDPCDGGE